MAPFSKSNPKRDSVPKSCPERVSIPKGIPESPEAHKCSSSSVVWQHLCSPSAQHLCASESRTRLIDPAAPPWLLALSTPPWHVSPMAPLASLVPPALPWSGDDHPAPRDSTPLAASCSSVSVRLLHLFGSTFVLCRSGSTADSRIHVSSSVAGTIDSTSALRILLVTVAHRLSISTSSSSTTCSTVVSRPLESSPVGSTVGRHHGCGLGPAWLLLLQVPAVISLAPPSVWSTLVPPVSSLAPPAVVSTLDSVHRPPPKPLRKLPPIPSLCVIPCSLCGLPCVFGFIKD
ncbi:Zinc homeostasis factor 1 [Labeo rohita]|uniref:Zinc homeostasis factor 1 n=1 Tax=Labeo rohita TaxID=84645 RepID=A0ABQ8MH23_LABRO|nr:Zinc homeostasis factor 1 [Labeo rohita]